MRLRTIIAILIIAVGGGQLLAQDDYFNHSDQGTLYLSAGTNFGLSRTGDSLTVFDISSNLGYFLFDNFCLGGSISLTYSDFGGDVSSTRWQAGPFARAYIGNSFFGGALIIDHIPGTGEQFAARAEAGYPIFLGENIAFEPTVSYLFNFEDSSNSTFNLNFGFAIYFAGRPDY